MAAPGSIQWQKMNENLIADFGKLKTLAQAPTDARQRIHLLPIIDVHMENDKVVVRTPQTGAGEVLHPRGRPAPALATWLFLEGIHALHHLHSAKIGHGAVRPTAFLAFDIPPQKGGPSGDAVAEYNSRLAHVASDVLVPLYKNYPLLCHLFLAIGTPQCVLSGDVRVRVVTNGGPTGAAEEKEKDAYAPPALSKTHQQYLDSYHKTSTGDIWSLASTVFAVATGRVITSEEDHSLPNTLSLLSPSQRANGWNALHPALQDILSKCLAPQPQARPSSDAIAQDPRVRDMSARAAAAERVTAEQRESLLALLTSAAKDKARAEELDRSCIVPPSVGERLRTAAGEGHLDTLGELLLTFYGDAKTINSKDCRLGSALHHAASRGQTRAVSLLLAHGADPASTNARNVTSLSLAAERGHTDCLRALLSVLPSRVNAVETARRWTLLHTASSHLQLNVVRFLLQEMGADPGCADSNGRLALEVVATSPALLGRHGVLPEALRKQADALVALLRSPPPPSSSSPSSPSSASPVSVESMLADLARLVEKTRLDAEDAKAALAAAQHRALLFSPSSFSAFPPDLASQLRAAAAASNIKLLTMLLARASERPQIPQVQQAEKEGESEFSFSRAALVLASAVGKLDAALAAAVNEQDASGWSACLLAARSGDPLALTALVKAGGKVDIVNSISKQTALHVAASNGHASIVHVLLSLPAFASQRTTATSLINALDARGATAIHYAREKGHGDVARSLSLFEEAAAAAEKTATRDGFSHKHFSSSLSSVFAPLPPQPPPTPTPPTSSQVSKLASAELHRLAKMGDHHQARNLLKQHRAALANADVEQGRSALYVASRNGHSEVVKVMLAFGGDPLARCNQGRTALHAAADRGHAKVLRILIESLGQSSDVSRDSLNLTDNQGNTALHLACRNGRKDAIRLLVASGASSEVRNREGRTCGEEAVLSTHRVTLEHALVQRGWT